ncbi:MAG: hypothetical protein OCD00_12455 [Colwellia sp.]
MLAQATGQGAFPLNATSENNFVFLKAGIEIKFEIEKPQFVIYQGERVDSFVRVGNIIDQEVTVSNDIMESYKGLYKSPNFPLDISVFVKKGTLMAQASGQGSFILTPTSQTKFKFSKAGIIIQFDKEKNQLTISQGGKDTLMTKS